MFFLKKIVDKFIRLFVPPVERTAFDIADIYRKRGMSIGKETYIYGNVVFGTGLDGLDPIVIGENCVLTGCTILGHDASTNKYLGIKYSIRKPVVIEDNCFIGYGAIILMGVTIEHDSIVGAGSVVTSDVPERSVVAGNPARVICTLDQLVEKRQQLAIEHPEYFRDKPDLLHKKVGELP